MRRSYLVFIALLFVSQSAYALTRTWDGEAGDGLWSSATNWVGDTLPQPADDILFDTSGGSLGDIYMDIDVALDGSMTMGTSSGGGSVRLFINSGVTFTLDGSVAIRRVATLINDGAIQGGGVVRVLLGRFTNNNTVSGISSFVSGFTYTNNGTMDEVRIDMSSGTFENNGYFDHATIRSIPVTTGAHEVVNNVGATINLVTASLPNNFGEDLTFNNLGTVVNLSAITNMGTFNNSGTLDNTSGTFNLVCEPENGLLGSFNNTGVVLGNAVSFTPGSDCVLWDNDSGNGLWSEPLNWSQDTLPQATDTIIINGENGADTSVRLDLDFTVENILFIGNHSGGTVNTEFVVDSMERLTNDGELVIRADAIINNEGQILNNGEISQRINALFQGPSTINNIGTFTNPGTVILNPTSSFLVLTVNNSGAIDNTGSIELSCSVNFIGSGTISGNAILGRCKAWDGEAGDGLWSSATNWVGDTLPQPADDILFDTSGGSLGDIYMDIDVALDGSMTMGTSSGGGSVRLFINSGVTFTLDGSVAIRRVATLINDGAIQGGGVVRVLLGRFTNNNTVSGISSFVSGFTYTNNGTMDEVRIDMSSGTFENNGYFDHATIRSIPVTTGAHEVVNNVGATINLVTASLPNNFGEDLTFNNLGTVVNLSAITNNGTFDNFGVFDNIAGTFDNQGSFTSECDSTLLGSITGNPPIEVICDTTPPVITVPEDITVEATSSLGATVSYAASADDNFDGAISPACSPASGSGFALGATVVTCTATDQAGNAASASFEVDVVDTTPPLLVVPADVTAEANAMLSAVDIGTATATDFYLVSVTNDAPSVGFPLGSTPVTWTAHDFSGNSATGTQSVTVVDTTAPVIEAPPDISMEATGVFTAVTLGAANATDIFLAEVSNDAPQSFPLGTTVVTWTATDTSGNSASTTQNVTVVDTTPPDLTIPPDITFEANPQCLGIGDIGMATAFEIVDPDPVITNDAADTFQLGQNAVVWTAIDDSGNSASAVQIVTVIDVTPPTIGATVSPDLLWPPNHKMVSITPTLAVADNCSVDSTGLESIIMDEGDETLTYDPDFDDTQGDGNTTNDIQVKSDGGIWLRSERSGKGDGRTYSLVFSVTDGSSNSTEDTVQVVVPHNN